MSPTQHKFFYFPAWNKCARACGWNTQKGIWAQTDPRSEITDFKSIDPLRAQVIAHANQLARAQHRGPKPDDFRKACHLIALGRPKSSLALTNDECQRVVDLFAVLEQPDSIEAVMNWQDPLRSKKKNLIVQASAKAPEAYIESILKDYHVACLEDMTIPQIQKLCFTLNQRKASWNGKPQSRRDTEQKTNSSSPLSLGASVAKPKLQYVKGPF